MTLRKLYQKLRKQYLRNQTHIFPLFINLRDHFGQTNASEILERHARLIGFPNPSHIVRAWRAGYASLLIDGIDEITTTGIQGLWKKLQDTRYRATQGIRELIRDHPEKIGIALAGRAHFFDSERERNKALGLSSEFHQLSLNEFTDQQIRTYLERAGLAGDIPAWLPTRPLLIGYLASRNILGDVISEESSQGDKRGCLYDPAKGWNHLIDKVCDRESDIEAGIDGETVRKILERLATIARGSQDGLGPLTPEQVVDAFKQICGYSPDEKGMLLLQRLPGLGIDRVDEETRKFVDISFADVCRAGDISAFVFHPYDFECSIFESAEYSMDELGCSVAGLNIVKNGVNESKANATLLHAFTKGVSDILCLDSCMTVIQNGWDITNPGTASGAFVKNLNLDTDLPDISKLVFRDCYFSRIYPSEELIKEQLPIFNSCYIGEIEGRLSTYDLPNGLFDENCVIDAFASSEKTTKAIINSDLPLGVKVLLTVTRCSTFSRRDEGRPMRHGDAS